MKKFLLFFFATAISFLVTGQNLDLNAALKLVSQHRENIGLAETQLEDFKISDAYFHELSKTNTVYLQQVYKGLPVFNQLLVLAFKEDKVVSKAGAILTDMDKLTGNGTQVASMDATAAVKIAFSTVKLGSPAYLVIQQAEENGRKLNFGMVKGVTENVTAELLWAPTKVYDGFRLAWQVFVAPVGTSDTWLFQVDALTGQVLHQINLTIYEGHVNRVDKLGAHYQPKLKSLFFGNGNAANVAPPTVTSANYRVLPMPTESPKHGAIAVVNNPWLAAGAGNNAITNGWHFDGTTNYDITRGNNVFAYLDVQATNAPNAINNWPDTSTTTNPSLNFDFLPNFTLTPTTNINKKFAVANLFYWNNLMHDVTYQYGFTEVAGNFQTDNMGRGGNGNDYVQAEAQDGGGTNNANFSITTDGNRPRMQMYIFDPVTVVRVNTPASISGDYEATESAFSTANKLSNLGPVTGQVVYYNDDAAGTSHFACVPPVNSIAGKIALIVRGGGGSVCPTSNPFVEKVKNAQLAGAIAVIVVNNVAGAPGIMGGTDNTITIPAVMVSQSDGAIFAANLGSNLNVTLSAGVNIDGDLDNGVVCHEYGHGVSTRLTGGPSTGSCLTNAEQGGEGWSDYMALMMTTNWATTSVSSGANPRTVGTYVVGQSPTTGAGIRLYPFSTSLTLNPLTYASLGVAPVGTEVHNVGDVWCTAIWEMTWAIIQQQNSITANIYNAAGTGGNVIAYKLVMEGLRLQPCSPGFLDARNAIINADINLYGGAHLCAIWTAFAKRGMGFSALQGSAFSATDQTAAFDLPPGPTISSQPVSATVCTGANATFTVAGTASGINYTWQVSTNGGTTWTNISPAVTTPTLTLTNVTLAMNGYQYRAVVNGGCIAPTTVNSSPATLTVTSSTPTITSQPANATTCAGNSATFTVAASGTNLTYSWQVSTDGGTTWTTLSPAVTTATLTLSNVTTAMNNNQYRAIVTGNCGTPASANSNGGILTVAAGGVTINSQPASSTSCSGTNATFTVNATGTGLTYVWQVSTDGGVTWTNVSPAATTPTLTLNSVTIGMNNNQYRVVISYTGACTGSSNSNAAVLAVSSGPTITTQPVNATICIGDNASFCVTATGAGLTYQWQVSATGCAGAFANITGATANCYNISNAAASLNGSAYRVIINGTCPSPITSDCATVSVNTAAVITSQPANATVCPGSPATFSSTATGLNLTYQWQVSSNGGTTWTNITGATAAGYTLTGTTTAMNNNQYRVVVFSCGPTGVNSLAATLTVSTPAAITTQPTNVAVCAGANASFTVNGTGITSFQWQVSTNGGSTWTSLTGATSPTYSITNVTISLNGNQYRAIINGTCVTGQNSNAATLTLNTPVQITTPPTNIAVCTGEPATFSVVTTGTTITYQWQESSDAGTTWVNISGATNASYTVANPTVAMNGRMYRVIATGAPCGAVTSTAATLTVNVTPVSTLTSSIVTGITPVNRATLTVSTVPAGNYTYRWYVNGTLDPTKTGSTAEGTVDNIGNIHVIATNTTTGCSGQSNTITLSDAASSIVFIYPNPSNGRFMVRYYSSISNLQRYINVYDSRGARVYSKAYTAGTGYSPMPVDIRNAAAGTYRVELLDNNKKRIAVANINILR